LLRSPLETAGGRSRLALTGALVAHAEGIRKRRRAPGK
jgi:hypothetical protein